MRIVSLIILTLTMLIVFEIFGNGNKVRAQQTDTQPSPSPTPKPSQEKVELNTILMRSTFKVVGNGSLGTAFIVGRQSKKNPDTFYYVMVTAAHVLESSIGNQINLLLRQKNKDVYSKGMWQIPIRDNGKPLWTKHPRADVAVLYVKIPTGADIIPLPTSWLATDEMLNEFEIHPGDNLFCLGFPNGIDVNDGGFPILRSGRIASYPILPTTSVKAFLFDFNVFEGNSGGPVYFVDNLRYYKGSFNAVVIQFIVGLVSEEVFASGQQLPNGTTAKEPLRLAIVIHASLIREAIDSLPSLDK